MALKKEDALDYFLYDGPDQPKEEDVLQHYTDRKLLTIAELLPKYDLVTGPASQPFTLLEDMIILVLSKPYIRRKYLEHTQYVSGSALTLQFWTKVNEVLSINRSSDSMRSRYNRVLAQIHPKEYDQFIQLL